MCGTSAPPASDSPRVRRCAGRAGSGNESRDWAARKSGSVPPEAGSRTSQAPQIILPLSAETTQEHTRAAVSHLCRPTPPSPAVTHDLPADHAGFPALGSQKTAIVCAACQHDCKMDNAPTADDVYMITTTRLMNGGVSGPQHNATCAFQRINQKRAQPARRASRRKAQRLVSERFASVCVICN